MNDLLQTQLGLRQVKLSFKITKYVRHLLRTCFLLGDQIHNLHLFIFFLFSPSMFLSFAREGDESDESLSWDLTPKSFPSSCKNELCIRWKVAPRTESKVVGMDDVDREFLAGNERWL